MKTNTWYLVVWLFLLLITPQSIAQDVSAGKFPPVDLIETELQRGISTTADVEKILGRPAGRGGYLAIMDSKPRKVWYYHDINSSLIDVKDSVMRMHTHTQVLLVYFLNDRFNGYKWFTSSAAARAK